MLTIAKLKDMKPGGRMVICTEPLYRTTDGSIVGADHPERRWKYCGAGQEIQASVWDGYRAGTSEVQEAKSGKPAKGKGGKGKGGKGKGGKKVDKANAAPAKEAKVNQQAETKEAVPETKEAKPETKASRSRKNRPREGQQE